MALCGRVDGAGNRIRTYDPRITNALLYQLSYPGAGAAILSGDAPAVILVPRRSRAFQVGVGPGPGPTVGPKPGGVPPVLPRWDGHSAKAT